MYSNAPYQMAKHANRRLVEALGIAVHCTSQYLNFEEHFGMCTVESVDHPWCGTYYSSNYILPLVVPSSLGISPYVLEATES